jgi:hypothetical protein
MNASLVFFILAALVTVLTVDHAYSQDEFTIGQIKWDRLNYPVNNTAATIQVIDPDMNKIAISRERITVHVYSDSNPEGIFLEVFETEPNSGIFEKTFVLSQTRSAPNILQTLEGDTATAKYIDTTLPAPYLPSDKLEVTETAIMGVSGPPLERVPASSFRIQDLQGNIMKIPTILVDQQILLVADIENQQDREQDFAFFVQIQDENKVTVSLSWITGTLTPLQSFSPSQSWIPQVLGKYTGTLFVWESLDNPSALSPPLELEIAVTD